MANTESIREIAHSRAPLSTWLGVVLLFALFGVIVLAIIGPMPRGSDYEEMRAKQRMEKLKTVHEDAQKALNTYAWIDKSKGVAQIPISRAMELTVADLAKQKPAPAGPIVAPQQPAAPVPAGSPAPTASPKAGAAQPAASPGAPAPAVSAASPAQPAASPATQTSASPSPTAAASSAPTSPAPAQTP
ncbi:MAG TPA: hypothetical protein VH254_05445 [Candidatus Udaeobacter sp.]|jgi:hypothetical protein|nr:hypothetical protein [Candidatus Udaeobacter sp.]